MQELLYDIHLIYSILIFILTLLSAFFSATETSLVSANRFKLETMALRGNKKAKRALYILDHIENAIGMILIGNNIANIMATAFITFLATKAFMVSNQWILLVTVIQAVIFLVLCEVTPKIIARSIADSYLLFFSYPIIFLMLIFKPAIKLSLAISRFIEKLLNFKSTSNNSLIMNRDEINILFSLGGKDGVIDESHSYISEILQFKEKMAYEVMTPSIEIISIESRKSFKDLVYLIDNTRFSRIPVYEDRVDNIIGYVFYRDLLKHDDAKHVYELINKAQYVPTTKNIYELYLEMIENTLPIVFIVNEFGAVVGMVTHEDIVEELVGEINTRDHSEEDIITKISDNKYILDANLDIEFFAKTFSIKIEKKGFETIAGFIIYMLGKIPKKGDSLKYEKYTFIIEEGTDRALKKIMLTLPSKKRIKKIAAK